MEKIEKVSKEIWIDSLLDLNLDEIEAIQRIVLSKEGEVEDVILFLDSLEKCHFVAIGSKLLKHVISCSC